MSPRRPSVHAIVGSEKAWDSYLAEASLERALAEAVGEQRDAVQVMRGDETSWARVLDAARTRSLFAERRAVVVRDAHKLRGVPRGGPSEGEEDDAEDEKPQGVPEGLEAYLDDPTPGVTLILVAPRADLRRALWKLLQRKAELVKAEPLKGQRLKSYVADELRRRKLRLEPDAVGELIDSVGQDLRRLMGELDKLEAFAAGRGGLSAEEVAAVLGRGMARPLYELSDAFQARRAPRALELIEASLDEGEAPLRILGTLQRALRQLRGLRALRLARVAREELAGRLQILPFKLGEMLAAERAWPERGLARALGALGRADRWLKTSVDPRVALTAAVVDALGGGTDAPATPSSRRGR